MGKNSDKEQQKIDSRERIFQTAISLFAHQGFAATGMRELATNAEVTLSMVNYFFGSKKELLKMILDNFFTGYLDIARAELAGDGSLHSRLERFISSAVNYFDVERDSLIIAISELPHDDPEIVEHKATWAKQMVEIVNQEVCLPLAAKTGQYIPPTCLAPMLTSFMASRFLFAPLMKEVESGRSAAVNIEEYSKMLSWILLQGMIGADNKALNQCSNKSIGKSHL